MKDEIISCSEYETELLGRHIGSRLKGGEVIVLKSDLGGGKTALARGIVIGVDSDDMVSSPTFTISQVYPSGRIAIHHYDLYRLSELGVMSEDLVEALARKDIVTVIEWPELSTGVLPDDRTMYVRIDRQKEGENYRKIAIHAPESLDYLIDRKKLSEALSC